MNEPRGQIECPICGSGEPHRHEPLEVEIERFCRPAFEKWAEKRIAILGRAGVGRIGVPSPIEWEKRELGIYIYHQVEVAWQAFQEAWLGSDATTRTSTYAAPQSAGVSENDSERNSTCIEGFEQNDSVPRSLALEANALLNRHLEMFGTIPGAQAEQELKQLLYDNKGDIIDLLLKVETAPPPITRDQIIPHDVIGIKITDEGMMFQTMNGGLRKPTDAECNGMRADAETRRNDSGECQPPAVFADPIPSPVSEAEVIERWQPIETAPKDGVGFLSTTASGWQTVVCWNKHRSDWCIVAGNYPPYPSSETMTHWMPLPAPPRALSTPIGK